MVIPRVNRQNERPPPVPDETGRAGTVSALLLVGCTALPGQSAQAPNVSVQAPANLPPAGTVWFGHSFNATTFEIPQQITTVGAHEGFSMVARFTQVVDGTAFAIRVSYNGQLVATTPGTYLGSSDTWGFSPGPLFSAGVWRYDFTDIGGNVLATGEITAIAD